MANNRDAWTEAVQQLQRPKVARSKYGAQKTTVDGIVFHSKREAQRYHELTLMLKAGKIQQLMLQPRYGLYVKPFARAGIAEGELIRIGDYVGDFQYIEAGQKVLEDVKGVRTDVYKLKKKFVEALYGIQIRET